MTATEFWAGLLRDIDRTTVGRSPPVLTLDEARSMCERMDAFERERGASVAEDNVAETIAAVLTKVRAATPAWEGRDSPVSAGFTAGQLGTVIGLAPAYQGRDIKMNAGAPVTTRPARTLTFQVLEPDPSTTRPVLRVSDGDREFVHELSSASGELCGVASEYLHRFIAGENLEDE